MKMIKLPCKKVALLKKKEDKVCSNENVFTKLSSMRRSQGKGKEAMMKIKSHSNCKKRLSQVSK